MGENRKKILIVTNVQTKGNPALWFIYTLLSEKYSIIVFGNERKPGPVVDHVDYHFHSSLFSVFTFLKMDILLKGVLYLLTFFNKEKARDEYKVVMTRIHLNLNRLEFELKFKSRVDFIINIDTEAAFVTYTHSRKNKIPNAYFIYEIFAEQHIQEKDKNYHYKTWVEMETIKNCNVILSSANEEIAAFLLTKYSIDKKILVFTVCPEKASNLSGELASPMTLYYHGGYLRNRGIQEAIIAMKEIQGAVLYLRGFGNFEKEIRQTAIDHKVEDKVFFLPPVPTEELTIEATKFDVGLTLGRMNVLNHMYAVGFKTFENISAGLALVLPESYPLKKLNDQYHVAITYKDATVENLVEVFSYCVAHPEEVMEWKRNARAAYESEYNPKRQQQKLIDTIESLIKA